MWSDKYEKMVAEAGLQHVGVITAVLLDAIKEFGDPQVLFNHEQYGQVAQFALFIATAGNAGLHHFFGGYLFGGVADLERVYVVTSEELEESMDKVEGDEDAVPMIVRVSSNRAGHRAHNPDLTREINRRIWEATKKQWPPARPAPESQSDATTSS